MRCIILNRGKRDRTLIGVDLHQAKSDQENPVFPATCSQLFRTPDRSRSLQAIHFLIASLAIAPTSSTTSKYDQRYQGTTSTAIRPRRTHQRASGENFAFRPDHPYAPAIEDCRYYRNTPQAACTLVSDAFRQSTESRPASIALIVQRRAAIQNCWRWAVEQNF